MARLAAFTVLVAIAGCNGPTTSQGPIEGDFDKQIDGLDNLEGGDEIESFQSQLCVAGNGNVYVVWRDDRDGFSDVWFNKSTDGGESFLGVPIRVKQGPGNATGVHMACAGDRVYVVWEDDRDGETNYQNIYLNYSADAGETWQPEDQPVDNDEDGTAISLGPRIALYQGRVHVIWYDQVEGAPDVYMATSGNGGRKFEVPVRISGNREEEGAGDAWSGNPRMALDANGRVYATWEDTRNGKQDIFFAASANGAGFNPQKRVDTGDTRGSAYSFSPRIDVSETDAYVVWHDSRFSTEGGGRDIYLNHSTDGGETWLENALRVEGGDAVAFSESINPEILVQGRTAHLVWQDARNVGYDIFYRKAEAGVFDDTEAGLEVRLDRDPPGAGNSAQPKIVTDGRYLVVAWLDYRADPGQGYNDIYYNFMDLQAEEPQWSDSDYRLDSIADGTSFTESLSLAVFDGVIHASWVDGRNGTRDIFYSKVLVGEQIDQYLDFVGDGAE